MRPTYDRNVNVEQCKGGLVIIQAWYGVFGSSNKLIDVTVPVQCLVSNSKLILPEHTKVISFLIFSLLYFWFLRYVSCVSKGFSTGKLGHIFTTT